MVMRREFLKMYGVIIFLMGVLQEKHWGKIDCYMKVRRVKIKEEI